ncbi:MFS transporter [Corynebacterium striatum]|uniref:MFS transporter n=1 Tax=Corynebacterium striatum TaxID=43770 RepID=UPI00254EA9F8|nr:MFS transporter [Corynebacterium striatum]MDK8826306.1 MFS transporter [Corynebacterium striatum]MDK8882303.1 MFS transporter [Corynebacterium striatum]
MNSVSLSSQNNPDRADQPRVPRQTEISSTRRTLVTLALALGAFSIGTTEFVSMGLLPLIAGDFGITEDTASTLITVYAIGVVVGAPVISAVTGKLPRRRLIILLIGFLLVGNLLTALAPNYATLLAARFIAGLPHGAYFSVANLSAAAMAPKGGRGKAMAAIGMGLAVATVMGVPAAQALGQNLGWHSAYFLVVNLALATMVLLYFLFPHMTEMPSTDISTELGALKNLQVWLSVIMGIVGFGGMFAVYTYITWTMTEVAGMPDRWTWAVLMVYGIGMTIGNGVGGALSDRNTEYSILFALVFLVETSLVFYFGAHNLWLATIAFGFLAFFGAVLIPSLQLRLMIVAGDAQTLASALNQSALNIANAMGAALGGLVVGAGFNYNATSLVGVVLASLGIIVWIVSQVTAKRSGVHVKIIEQS